ncbi:M56 family metallopeptidase [Mucilaginibacter sp. BJC16-A38]|uniref:M56 family metallopeptidase n=1 Tax=Mucilaginibacter phenanthrenivorans TaxID=1234842 RepID=UPI00215819A4|nr:M56 family metallopeptidase [Mucilaginibacter phenanthrenivorans]MCR8560916.1 M56 family metallopeptidase [Mucilaginibacter phenanthrenivorans]
MTLSTTGSLLTDQLIKALGNTLMHSLWQGILLAVAGGLIIVFTKRLSAALRYNLLLGAMVLFTCGVAVTFIMQLQPLQSHSVIYKGGAMISAPANQNAVSPIINADVKQSPADLVTGFLNTHSDTIVLIWFLIICIKSIKLAVGGYEVYRLKHSKIYSVSDYWDNRISQLANQLKIKQAVSLLESGIAKVPMVIGHLKPVILIPIGFINALSSDEVEAILVHELAHIRRRDYLVNLLQSFMEIVFFFNPAVIWISQLIKAERENCCDDIALGQAGNKSNYIQALLSCQEYQAPGLSIALANNKNTLLNRVKRIVNNHNQSLNIMEKTLLTIGLVTAGLFTVAFSAKDTVKKAAKVNQVQQPAIVVSPVVDVKVDAKVKVNTKVDLGKIDTTQNMHVKVYKPSEISEGTTIRMRDRKNWDGYDMFLVKRNGELYQLMISHNKATRLYVNGEAAQIDKYSAKVDDLMNEFKKLGKTPPVPPVAPAPPTGAVIATPPTLGAVRAPRVPKAMAMTGPAAPAPPAPMIAMTGPALTAPAAPRIAMTGPAAPVPPTPVVAMVASPAVPAAPDRPAVVAMVAPVAPVGPKSLDSDVVYNKMTDKLIQKGIINDKNNLDISISNDELKVNGVKQPENIHQEILKLYVTHPGDKVSWSYSNHK